MFFFSSCFWHSSKHILHFHFQSVQFLFHWKWVCYYFLVVLCHANFKRTGSFRPLCAVTELLGTKTTQEKVGFDSSCAEHFSLLFAGYVSIVLLHCLRWREDLAVCTPSLSPVTTARVQPSPTPSSSETRVCWWVSPAAAHGPTWRVCSDHKQFELSKPAPWPPS